MDQSRYALGDHTMILLPISKGVTNETLATETFPTYSLTKSVTALPVATWVSSIGKT